MLLTSRSQAQLLCALGLFLMAACTSTLEGPTVDYQSDNPPKPTVSLEVPPDLKSLPEDNRYNIPGSSRSATTASEYAAESTATAQAKPDNDVLRPNDTAQLVRDGGLRYALIKLPPEAVYSHVREFWQKKRVYAGVRKPRSRHLRNQLG